ncbi:MAG: zinc-binding dehydrogenase [Bdellovibrionota bacterium]
MIAFGANTAWSFLIDKVKIKDKDTILINGASGSPGSAAIQIAKKQKAFVTAVCSKENFKFVKSLGADEVIFYKESDFTKLDQKYNFIMDVMGNLNFSQVKNSLSENGKLILVSADLPQMIYCFYNNLINKKKIIVGVAVENKGKL